MGPVSAEPAAVALDLFRLDGKVALVTGASRGLGRGIAQALASAGADVVLHASETQPVASAADIKAATGRRTATVTANLGERDAADRLIADAIACFGQIDILVNNAGIIRREPAAEHSDENWDDVLEVNLSSVFRLSRAAGRHMLARGEGGKIISIASMLSFQGGINVPGYAAAKGGLVQLTKALANEWAPRPATWRPTIPARCGPIRSAFARSPSGFRRGSGARRRIWPVRPSFSRRAPPTTCTVTCWWSTAAG